MTIVLASLVVILTLGYLPAIWLVLRHLRERDQSDRLERAAMISQHQALLRGFADQVREAHQSRADEIATLLQRIQAPQQAVIDHSVSNAEETEAILPLTDDEAAKQRAEVIERIEEFERSGLTLPEVIG